MWSFIIFWIVVLRLLILDILAKHNIFRVYNNGCSTKSLSPQCKEGSLLHTSIWGRITPLWASVLEKKEKKRNTHWEIIRLATICKFFHQVTPLEGNFFFPKNKNQMDLVFNFNIPKIPLEHWFPNYSTSRPHRAHWQDIPLWWDGQKLKKYTRTRKNILIRTILT